MGSPEGRASRVHATRRVVWGAGALLAALIVATALAPGATTWGTPRAPAAPGELGPLLAALTLQSGGGDTPAPRFVLRTLEGRAVTAEDFRGKVVLVSFFATWCPTCKSEMPALRRLAERFRGTEFVLLMVSYGERGEAVRPFAAELRFAHEVLLDTHMRVGDDFGVKFLPTHYLIGRGGELVATGVGPKAWDGPAASRLIGSLL